jgi:tight adherence protein C
MMFGIGLLIAGLLIGSRLPEMGLKGKANKRKDDIRFSLADVLDLMVVCVEAGLGLDATLNRVSEEAMRISPPMGKEFKRVTKELNAGLPRSDVFGQLGKRVGVDELRSLCALIVQSDKMGTSIADGLRVYAEDLRVRKRQRAEELAAKASIKMTLPLVFFVFPPLMIILLGPAVLSMMDMFMK